MKDPAEFCFKVLNDNCSSIDLTTDQTHAHIADKLYALISDPEQQGLTIGLEGEWGSGKSTVVKLLRSKLEEDPNTLLFYTDAWEHEGDHLRRVFLEKLIETVRKWLEHFPDFSKESCKSLDDIEDRVAAKKSEKTIKRHSRTNKFGTTMGFAVLLVPIGSPIFVSSLNQITWHWTGTICWKFWIGLLLTGAPALRLAGRYICNRFRSKKKSYDLFETTATEETIQETSREDERSSVEFGKFFTQIVELISCKLENMVIIIDNLDRVDTKDALRIWSTLQTFVQYKNPSGSEQKRPRRWIIVPYAQEGLSRIWEEQAKQTIKEDNPPHQERQMPSGQESTEAQVFQRADSFMDKSFQLRLHVPKMVISGWKDFAQACIRQAFPNMNESDRVTILNVLDWTRANVTDIPSPRQIKVYVNEVGVAELLNYHNVSLSAICLYAVKKYLHCMSNAQLEKELITGQISQNSVPQIDSSHVLSAEVAAILYGVPEGKAMEILLMPIITSALEKGQADLLAELRKIHGNAFDSVLALAFRNSNSIYGFWKYAAQVQMAFEDINLPPCQSAFHVVKEKAEMIISDMSLLDAKIALALIKLSRNDQVLERELTLAYASSLPKRMLTKTNETSPEIKDPADFFSHHEELCRAVGQKVLIPYKNIASADMAFFEPFSSDNIQQLVSIVDNADLVDDDIAKTIKPGTPLSPVTEKVLSAFVAGGLTQVDETAKATKAAFEWNNGNQQNRVFSSSHFKLIRALIMVHGHRPVPELLELLKGQCLWNCWRQNQNFDEINAVMITLVETLFPGMQKTELEKAGINWGNVNELRNKLQADSKEFAEFLYSMICEDNGYTWLREEVLSNARQNSNISICKVIYLACQAHDDHIFNSSRQYETLMKLAECIGEDKTDELFKLFCSDETRLKALTGSECLLVAQYPQLTLRFLQQISPESPWRKSLEEKCASALKEIKEDDWKKEFEGKPILRPLVEYLVNQRTSPFLDNPFLTAFQKMITSTIKEQRPWNVTTEQLRCCYFALGQSFRNTIDYDIAEALLTNSFAIHTAAVKEFVLTTPNFAEWLRPRLSELQAKAPSLANPNNIQSFSNFLVFVERNKDNITNINDIGEVIAKPVRDMISSNNNAIRTIGEKAASLFGLISPDSEERHA